MSARLAPDFWCPLRGHQTAGAHAGTNGHHRAHKWPNMGTMLIQPMSGQWCPRVGTGGLEPTNGHHGAHGGLKMCSAHGTLRGHRQPIVGTANPLPIYGHCSPLIASAALVPIVGCVELRMGTSVALAMGTRWFIFARAFAQRKQTRKGHGARGTGWLGLRKLACIPCYGCSTVFCTRRPSSGQGRSSPRRPDHNKDSTSRISKNARVATARNTTFGGPPPGR